MTEELLIEQQIAIDITQIVAKRVAKMTGPRAIVDLPELERLTKIYVSVMAMHRDNKKADLFGGDEQPDDLIDDDAEGR